MQTLGWPAMPRLDSAGCREFVPRPFLLRKYYNLTSYRFDYVHLIFRLHQKFTSLFYRRVRIKRVHYDLVRIL